MQRRLGAAATGRIGRVGVETVLHYVVIHGRKLHRHELAELLVDVVELVGVVGRLHLGFERGELAEDPAVEPGQHVVGHRVLGRIEVVEVRELVTQAVADVAVSLADLLEPLFADHDVAAVILRRHPQADHVRTVFLHEAVGRLRLLITALPLLRLGNLLAVLVDHEPVGQHGLEGRGPVAGEGEQQ